MKKAATAYFLVFLLLSVNHFGYPAQKTIRSEVSLVDMYFNVLDKKGKPVEGLKKEDFLVFENGIEQEIEFFSEVENRKDSILTMALLIDTSGSVKKKLQYEIDTASEFFRKILKPDRDLALIAQFDSEVNLVQDFTQDKNELIEALHKLKAGNQTSLYDAIYLIAEEKLRHEAGRKVMIIISDGSDTFSRISREEAIEAAERSDTIIYGIGVRGTEGGSGFGELEKFTERTGGAFFSPHAKFEEIQDAFRSIEKELRGQYSLAYIPKDRRKNGTFRSVEIRCRKKNVKIRARRGYYAPDEPAN